MVVEQVHVRLVFLVGAIGVLFLLPKPLSALDKPGSKGFVLTVLAISLWLGSSGLSYFVPQLRPTLALYSLLLFAITVCFAGWMLVAIEFTTGKPPSRPLLLVLGTVVVAQFLLLSTNFFWLHELVYRSSSTIENAVLVPDRGPAFWLHAALVYLLLFLSTVLFVAEWLHSSGLRRQQAGILAITPLIGLSANGIWLSGVLALSFDPTPAGVTVGVLLLSWALYRTEFLELAPVGRQTVIEEMTDAVVILDDSDRVVDWNRAARELFRVETPTAGMSVTAFFAVVPPETLDTFTETTRTDTQVSFELGGRERYFSVLLFPVDANHETHGFSQETLGTGHTQTGDHRDDGNEPLGRALVVRDITRLKHREQQLRKQNEHLDEFAGIVSHDLQGPLMEIRGSADAAVRTGDVAHVAHVVDAVDRMEQFVEDLLALARTGQHIASTEAVALAGVSSSAWKRVWSEDAELVVETECSLFADADRLQQLLENLFRNAVEHGSVARDPARPVQDGGRTGQESETHEGMSVPAPGNESEGGEGVTITVGSLPGGFYVEDDGPGISLENRERVFERGYTTAEGGTGFGLSIVQQIAGAHGWSVRVTDGETGGARFELTGVEIESRTGRQQEIER